MRMILATEDLEDDGIWWLQGHGDRASVSTKQ
jgi:hypothetical protein